MKCFKNVKTQRFQKAFFTKPCLLAYSRKITLQTSLIKMDSRGEKRLLLICIFSQPYITTVAF